MTVPKRALRPIGGWSTRAVLELCGSCLLLIVLILVMVFGFALLFGHVRFVSHVIGVLMLVVGLWLWRVILGFVISRFPEPPSRHGE